MNKRIDSCLNNSFHDYIQSSEHNLSFSHAHGISFEEEEACPNLPSPLHHQSSNYLPQSFLSKPFEEDNYSTRVEANQWLWKNQGDVLEQSQQQQQQSKEIIWENNFLGDGAYHAQFNDLDGSWANNFIGDANILERGCQTPFRKDSFNLLQRKNSYQGFSCIEGDEECKKAINTSFNQIIDNPLINSMGIDNNANNNSFNNSLLGNTQQQQQQYQKNNNLFNSLTNNNNNIHDDDDYGDCMELEDTLQQKRQINDNHDNENLPSLLSSSIVVNYDTYNNKNNLFGQTLSTNNNKRRLGYQDESEEGESQSHTSPEQQQSSSQQQQYQQLSSQESNKLSNNSEPCICNCKKTKCLKLYCECFAKLGYCGDNCHCHDCFNRKGEHEEERSQAIQDAKQRNQDSFMQVSSNSINYSNEQNKRGCNCKKTKCLKKYCECFNSGMMCGVSCKCQGCLNRIFQSNGDTFNNRDDEISSSHAISCNELSSLSSQMMSTNQFHQRRYLLQSKNHHLNNHHNRIKNMKSIHKPIIKKNLLEEEENDEEFENTVDQQTHHKKQLKTTFSNHSKLSNKLSEEDEEEDIEEDHQCISSSIPTTQQSQQQSQTSHQIQGNGDDLIKSEENEQKSQQELQIKELENKLKHIQMIQMLLQEQQQLKQQQDSEQTQDNKFSNNHEEQLQVKKEQLITKLKKSSNTNHFNQQDQQVTEKVSSPTHNILKKKKKISTKKKELQQQEDNNNKQQDILASQFKIEPTVFSSNLFNPSSYSTSMDTLHNINSSSKFLSTSSSLTPSFPSVLQKIKAQNFPYLVRAP